MPTASLEPVIACLRDTTLGRAMWPEVLPLIANAFGGAGAACFACNDQTGSVEWASIFGPVSAHKTDYLEHYATLDLYLPTLVASPPASWLTLSECLPENMLRHSEWYQDFIRPTGISDVKGIQLHQVGPHRLFFGIQYRTVQAGLPVEDARLQLLLKHLQQAARFEAAQSTLGLKAALGTWVLDRLGDAMFVADESGRIVEMNAAAESLLSRSNALAVRHGKLVAMEAMETRQLAALIARAGNTNAADGRMLVGQANDRLRQLLTVFPLQGKLAPGECATVAIRVVDLLARQSSGAGFADLFGFTPAEDRLAQGLMQGQTLQELTAAFGVKMPTLRAQMRSVLRKCGVQRQVDLVRILLGVC